MLKRSLIFVHRWLGVALCLLFLLWFPSGIGMMYWDFPGVSPADRLAHSPPLDPARVTLSPSEALAKLGTAGGNARLRLNTFDGRPVYRVRFGRDDALIYADTGAEQVEVAREMVDRVAGNWTRQSVASAQVEAVDEVDQWTIQGQFSALRPLWKYSWPDGQQVYVSQATGEVVQYTTTGSRLGAYVGAIPHWFYFTPLRKHGLAWTRVVIWTSAIATLSAILGVVIGLWMYSPSKRYRRNGVPTSIPYRGQKRWHTVFGLIFGIAIATWAFSGMLSMDPFPFPTSSPGDGREARVNLPQALRGELDLAAFDRLHPRDALRQLPNLEVKELEMTSFGGEPMYLATLADRSTRLIPLTGPPRREIAYQAIADLLTRELKPDGGADIEVLNQYDAYYLDRRRERPLPVVLARLYDADQTRYYIDPKTARIVGGYRSSDWVTRWLYHALHSFDFPWLYNYRPLWDIVVITFMVGGTALSVTSLVLAWRVLGRKLARAVNSGVSARPSVSEDLA